MISVNRQACLVPLRQKTPQMKTVVTGGASSAAIEFTAPKIL